MSDEEIRARIVTEWASEGERKVQEALKQFDGNLKTINDQMKSLDRKRALQQIAQDAAQLVREGKSASAGMFRLKSEIAKFGDATTMEVRRVVQEFDRLTDQIERTQQTASTPLRVQTADDRFGEVSRGVGLFGDTQANLGALASLTGSRELGVVGEVFALGEELPRLKVALQGLPEQIRTVVSTVGAGNIGLIGAIAAVGLVFGELSRRAQETRVELRAQLEAEAELNLLRKTSTPDEIESRQKAARQRRDAALEDIAAADKIVETFLSQFDDPEIRRAREQSIRDAVAATNLDSISTVFADQTLVTAIETLREQIPIAEEATQELIGYNETLSDTSFILRDLEGKLDEQREKSAATLEQLNEQEKQLIDSFEEANRQRQEDADLQRRFRDEDRREEDEQREVRHQTTLADIEVTGNERIESIREASLDRIEEMEAKLSESLAQIISDRDKRIEEVETDAAADEAKRAREFAKQEKKIDAELQRERIQQRLKDKAELNQIEAFGTTADFIFAQQRQKQEAQERDDEAKRAKADRRTTYEEEKRERELAAQERIADLRAEAEERTQAAIDAFNKEKSALETKTAEAIEIERAAIQQRLDAAVAAYQAETDALIASREKADERARIQEGIAEQRRQAAHNEQLNRIEARRLAENALADAILRKINALRFQLDNAQVLTLPSNAAGPVTGGRTVRAFAAGTPSTRGIYGDRAAVAVVNDVPPGWDEAIIPYRRSAGGPAGMGGIVVNVNGPLMVDDKMTRQDFKREMTTIIMEMGEGIAMARGRA